MTNGSCRSSHSDGSHRANDVHVIPGIMYGDERKNSTEFEYQSTTRNEIINHSQIRFASSINSKGKPKEIAMNNLELSPATNARKIGSNPNVGTQFSNVYSSYDINKEDEKCTKRKEVYEPCVVPCPEVLRKLLNNKRGCEK